MSGAVLSTCGRYRYHLHRRWGEGPSVTFIGVNPSTADASTDDATVRKWRGFSERWGYGAFDVVNLFAYRATDVRELTSAADPVGADNDEFLRAAFEDTSASLIVPCWGDRSKLPKALRTRVGRVRLMLTAASAPVRVFGLTASLDPKHPLMLGYATPLQDWLP